VQLKVVLFLLSIFTLPAFADMTSTLKVGASVGLGQGGGVAGGVTDVESPFGLHAYFDYSLDSRFLVGAEHTRSFTGQASSVGFTGLFTKWYPWTPAPERLVDTEDQVTKNYLVQKNISPYFGLCAGFGEAYFGATSTAPSVLAGGPYLGFKSGLEYPMYGNWGIQGEFTYDTTIAGAGQAVLVQFLLGIYYFL
jgi:hypothetical protein